MTENLLKAWSAATSFVLSLRALWFIIAAFLLAFGFGFKTPTSQFAEIKAVQDTFRLQLQIQKLRIDTTTMLLRSLAIAQCIDRASKGEEGQRELQLMQMPCNKLLESR